MPFQAQEPKSWVSANSTNLALSGRRGSNPRQPAWKAGTLPTELLPQILLYLTPQVRGDLFQYRLNSPDLRSGIASI